MERKNPDCPNCGKRMALAKQPDDPDGQHTFQCPSCNLIFITKDHVALSKPAE